MEEDLAADAGVERGVAKLRVAKFRARPVGELCGFGKPFAQKLRAERPQAARGKTFFSRQKCQVDELRALVFGAQVEVGKQPPQILADADPDFQRRTLQKLLQGLELAESLKLDNVNGMCTRELENGGCITLPPLESWLGFGIKAQNRFVCQMFAHLVKRHLARHQINWQQTARKGKLQPCCVATRIAHARNYNIFYIKGPVFPLELLKSCGYAGRMNWNLLVIRAVFFGLSLLGGYLICYVTPEWNAHWQQGVFLAGSIAFFAIAVDLFLRGFSLRGFTSLTLGLFVGWVAAKLIASSPLFDYGDPDIIYLVRMVLFLVLTYLGAVVALRGKDDFNFIIPFVRFVPQDVNVPTVIVDTSALIDGRIEGLCASKFFSQTLVIPQFVLDELHAVADSSDAAKRARGRKGLEVLATLKKMTHLDLRVHASDIKRGQNVDDKLIFLAQSLKARLLTTDANLAKLAEFYSVEWLNLSTLSKALHAEVLVGEHLWVMLVKPGKESGQSIGYMPDGSMVVVENSREQIGRTVEAEVVSVLPSAGGKMIFARLV